MAAGLEMYRIGGKSAGTSRGGPETQRVPSALLHLADLCFRQNILKDDILNASTLYYLVFQALGAGTLPEETSG